MVEKECPILPGHKGVSSRRPCTHHYCAWYDVEDKMCSVRSILGELKLISAALFGQTAPGGEG